MTYQWQISKDGGKTWTTLGTIGNDKTKEADAKKTYEASVNSEWAKGDTNSYRLLDFDASKGVIVTESSMFSVPGSTGNDSNTADGWVALDYIKLVLAIAGLGIGAYVAYYIIKHRKDLWRELKAGTKHAVVEMKQGANPLPKPKVEIIQVPAPSPSPAPKV